MKIYRVCHRCGSCRVSTDATAVWDYNTQEWIMSEIDDVGPRGGYCAACDNDCVIISSSIGSRETLSDED